MNFIQEQLAKQDKQRKNNKGKKQQKQFIAPTKNFKPMRAK